eukprot:7158177-Alexandrium_andersonii.AAC.1
MARSNSGQEGHGRGPRGQSEVGRAPVRIPDWRLGHRRRALRQVSRLVGRRAEGRAPLPLGVARE